MVAHHIVQTLYVHYLNGVLDGEAGNGVAARNAMGDGEFGEGVVTPEASRERVAENGLQFPGGGEGCG